MKLLGSILALVCGLALAHAYLNPVSVRTWGQRSNLYGETRLKHSVLYKDGKSFSFGRSVTTEFVYPEKNETNYRNITMISVTDQLNDKQQRLVTVREGGVGSNRVKLHFTAPRSRGYSYIVEIFG